MKLIIPFTIILQTFLTSCTTNTRLTYLTDKEVRYTSFWGTENILYSYHGTHICILAPQSNLDSIVITEILKKLDQAYVEFKLISGRDPDISKKVPLKHLPIAVVEKTCGRGDGCGLIGKKGIEISHEKFQILYEGMKENEFFDTLPLYELGRNFWFYDKQMFLGVDTPPSDDLRTGFAIFMRFILSNKLDINEGNLEGYVYQDYRNRLKNIYHLIKSNNSLFVYNLLFEEYSLKEDFIYNRSDVWASVLIHLYDQPGWGDNFVSRVWKELGKLPESHKPYDISQSFLIACERAMEMSLQSFFEDELDWKTNV